MGLSQPECDGLRDVLLYRAVTPDNATKLQIAIDLMPAPRAEGVQVFMDSITAARIDGMTRGQTALLAMSDDEWEGLFDGQV
jgi:hypothetical protein